LGKLRSIKNGLWEFSEHSTETIVGVFQELQTNPKRIYISLHLFQGMETDAAARASAKDDKDTKEQGDACSAGRKEVRAREQRERRGKEVRRKESAGATGAEAQTR
jgi:hypothetical protein